MGFSDTAREAFRVEMAASEEARRKIIDDLRAQGDAVTGLASGWERFTNQTLFNLDEARIGVREILKGWAAAVDGNVSEIALMLVQSGIDVKNLEAVWKAFTAETGLNIDALLERLGRLAASTPSGPGGQPGGDPSLTGDAARIQVLQGNLALLRSQRSQRLAAGLPVDSWDASIAAILEELRRLSGQSSAPSTSQSSGAASRVQGTATAGLTLSVIVNGDIYGMEDFEDKVSRSILDRLNAGGFPQLARA